MSGWIQAAIQQNTISQLEKNHVIQLPVGKNLNTFRAPRPSIFAPAQWFINIARVLKLLLTIWVPLAECTGIPRFTLLVCGQIKKNME